MELIPLSAADWAEFRSMSHQMYDSPAVAHAVSDDVFRATFDACLAGGRNIDGFLICNEDKTVGYLLLAHSFSSELGAPILMVEELFLKEEFRGKAIGRRMLELLRQQYTGKIGALKLECTPENAAAMHLYRSLGFEPLPYTAMVWPIVSLDS